MSKQRLVSCESKIIQKQKVLTIWHDSLSKSDSKAGTYNDGGKLLFSGLFSSKITFNIYYFVNNSCVVWINTPLTGRVCVCVLIVWGGEVY